MTATMETITTHVHTALLHIFHESEIIENKPSHSQIQVDKAKHVDAVDIEIYEDFGKGLKKEENYPLLVDNHLTNPPFIHIHKINNIHIKEVFY